MFNKSYFSKKRLYMTEKEDAYRVSKRLDVADSHELAVSKPVGSKKHVMFFTFSEDPFFTSYPVTSGQLRRDENHPHTLWGNPLLGLFSTKITCSNCRHAVHTTVTFRPSWRSYVATIFLSAIGLCCIPIYFKMYHHGAHFCPLCRIYLGQTGTEFSWIRSSHSRMRRASTVNLVE